jgi:hypothetical protein
MRERLSVANVIQRITIRALTRHANCSDAYAKRSRDTRGIKADRRAKSGNCKCM